MVREDRMREESMGQGREVRARSQATHSAAEQALAVLREIRFTLRDDAALADELGRAEDALRRLRAASGWDPEGGGGAAR